MLCSICKKKTNAVDLLECHIRGSVCKECCKSYTEYGKMICENSPLCDSLPTIDIPNSDAVELYSSLLRNVVRILNNIGEEAQYFVCECDVCNGKGITDDKVCLSCGGLGIRSKNE